MTEEFGDHMSNRLVSSYMAYGDGGGDAYTHGEHIGVVFKLQQTKKIKQKFQKQIKIQRPPPVHLKTDFK
ncbi:hypothetical protein PV325_014025 [Microctonus aethiopoides]|nr:hypothetical protein PV325_014025 [Microctonus aethiopoides]